MMGHQLMHVDWRHSAQPPLCCRHAELSVDGVRSSGTIDWVMVYKRLNIVVIEVSWSWPRKRMAAVL